MPRYVIERFFDRITDDDMLAATVRSDRPARLLRAARLDLEAEPERHPAPLEPERGVPCLT
jgi:hypothetical protein